MLNKIGDFLSKYLETINIIFSVVYLVCCFISVQCGNVCGTIFFGILFLSFEISAYYVSIMEKIDEKK